MFVDFSDSTKNFSLASQYDNVNILLLVGYVFELFLIKKVLNIIQRNEDGDYDYQGVKILYFQKAKDSIENNICYVLHIVSCLEECFGKFAEEALNSVEVDEKVIQDDQVSHDLCKVLDTRKWILLEVWQLIAMILCCALLLIAEVSIQQLAMKKFHNFEKKACFSHYLFV